MKGRINIYKAVNIIILLYMISTMFLNIISRNFSVNKILGVLLLFGLMFIIGQRGRRSEVIMSIALAFSAILAGLSSTRISLHLTDSIYFFLTIILYYLICTERFREYMYKFYEKGWVRGTVYILDISVLIMLFLPSCYAKEWGSASYFVGFTSSAHTIASNLCLLLTMLLLVLSHRKFSFWRIFWLLPPLYAIFATGARVFLLSTVVVVYFFLKNNIKRNEIKFLIYPLALLAGIYMLLNSGMMDKFNFVANNQWGGTAVESFTNGRITFWSVDFSVYFNDYNLAEKLVGKGFDNIYAVNRIIQGSGIWAHNDLLHVLLGTGLFGCFLMIWAWFKLYHNISITANKKRYYIVPLVVYIWLVALLNGSLVYVHYTLSIVCLVVYIGVVNSKKLEKNIH